MLTKINLFFIDLKFGTLIAFTVVIREMKNAALFGVFELRL
jgi:hypothetical protein